MSSTADLTTSFSSPLPSGRRSAEEVLADLEGVQQGDMDFREGLHQGLVYWPGDDAVAVAQEAMRRYYFSNPLLLDVFPSLDRIEKDIIAVAAGLLNAPDANGVITTGGSESNFLAVWTALNRYLEGGGSRERARVIVPFSAHPTFEKSCAYFGIEVVRVPLTDAFGADLDAVAAALTADTILLVGSAPDYSHGIVDPIPELGAIALEAGVPLHIDSCVGGFMLPFVERLGRPMPLFDFRVPGVTSMSADVHKHGLAPKGVSTLITREAAMAERSVFDFDSWPHGDYVTVTVPGSRSGASLAGAWAMFQFLGEEGYVGVARRAMEMTDAFQAGIASVPGLEVIGDPPSNKFAYWSTDPELDIAAIAAGMTERGWIVTFEKSPPAIGMQAQPYHSDAVGRYVENLAEVAELARAGKIDASGVTASYN